MLLKVHYKKSIIIGLVAIFSLVFLTTPKIGQAIDLLPNLNTDSASVAQNTSSSNSQDTLNQLAGRMSGTNSTDPQTILNQLNKTQQLTSTNPQTALNQIIGRISGTNSTNPQAILNQLNTLPGFSGLNTLGGSNPQNTLNQLLGGISGTNSTDPQAILSQLKTVPGFSALSGLSGANGLSGLVSGNPQNTLNQLLGGMSGTNSTNPQDILSKLNSSSGLGGLSGLSGLSGSNPQNALSQLNGSSAAPAFSSLSGINGLNGLSNPTTSADQGGCTEQTIDSTANNMTVPVSQLLSPEYVKAQNQAATIYYKICVLDPKAQALAKKILTDINGKTVNWVKSGMNSNPSNSIGNPYFVKNTGQFFGKLNDAVAGKTINDITPLIASPLRAQVVLSLATSRGSSPSSELTSSLTDAEYQSFSDSTGGSWSSWFNITQNAQNNPYGATMLAQNVVDTNIAAASGKYQQQLDWGNGYLNYEDCPASKNQTNSVTSAGNPVYDQDNQPVYGVYVTDKNCVTKTPGATIRAELENVLGSDSRGLEVAQSFDQVSKKLEGQLMLQTMGGTSGLAGANINSSAGYSDNSINYQKYIDMALHLIGGIGSSGNKTNPSPTPAPSPTVPTIYCVPSVDTISQSSSTPVIWVTAIAGGTPPFSYLWSFVDNNLTSTSTGLSVTKSYASSTPGLKTGSVVVTDKDGYTYSNDCSSEVNVTL